MPEVRRYWSALSLQPTSVSISVNQWSECGINSISRPLTIRSRGRVMSEYQWGDKVWLDLKTKAIITAIDEDDKNRPYSVATEEDFDEWVAANRLMPREDDKPKTWRLPEVGDTVRPANLGRWAPPNHGKEFVIESVVWDSYRPIRLEGLRHQCTPNEIELARLHDDHIADADKPTEPATPEPEPAVKCRFKVDDPVIYKAATDEHGKVVAVSEDDQTVKVRYNDGTYTVAADDKYLIPKPKMLEPKFKVGDPVWIQSEHGVKFKGTYKACDPKDQFCHSVAIHTVDGLEGVPRWYAGHRISPRNDDQPATPEAPGPKFKACDPVWCCGLPGRIEDVKYEPGGWWTYGLMSGVTALSEQRWTEQFITTRDVSHETATPDPTDADVSALPNRMVTTLTCDSTPQADAVNHPPHYNSHPSGVECITITEHMNFNVGNAIKYLWRADMKDCPIQNLEKAHWYIAREIERRKKMAQPSA